MERNVTAKTNVAKNEETKQFGCSDIHPQPISKINAETEILFRGQKKLQNTNLGLYKFAMVDRN
jgi:hypothetical protein